MPVSANFSGQRQIHYNEIQVSLSVANVICFGRYINIKKWTLKFPTHFNCSQFYKKNFQSLVCRPREHPT